MNLFKKRVEKIIQENEPYYIKNAKKLLNSKINKVTIHSSIGDYDWKLEDKLQEDIIKELIELFIEVKS
jgi:hypothetical protein